MRRALITGIPGRAAAGQYLGNLEARLDWGYAAEYAEAMRP